MVEEVRSGEWGIGGEAPNDREELADETRADGRDAADPLRVSAWEMVDGGGSPRRGGTLRPRFAVGSVRV